MAKIEPVTVPSDDCVVRSGGGVATPHEGESVTVIPGMTIADMAVFHRLAELPAKMDEFEGEAGGFVGQLRLMEEFADAVAPTLTDRIAAWTWTDQRGRPLPQPADDPTVFRRLSFEEIQYLCLLLRGRAPDQEKKDSSPSPITSSATARRRSRS